MNNYFELISSIDKNNFTKNELKILDYIENNFQKIIDQKISIDKLSDEVSVGYSVIYSFIKKIELDGYRDLIISLTKSDIVKKSENNLKLIYNFQNIIEINLETIKEKNVLKIINIFRQANKIYVYCLDQNIRHVSKYFVETLENESFNITFSENNLDFMNKKILNINEKDTFVFYSNSESINLYQDIFEKLGKKKIKIILISNLKPNRKILNSTNIFQLINTNNFNKNFTNSSNIFAFNLFNDIFFEIYQKEFGHEKIKKEKK